MYAEEIDILEAAILRTNDGLAIGIWQTLKTAVFGTTPNKQSMPPVLCECCEIKPAEISVCYDCYNKPA